MKHIAMAAFVAVALTSTASADDAAVVSKAKQFADLLHTVKSKQADYCAKPRSNTTERCMRDFEAVYPKIAELLGWQMVFEIAAFAGDTARIAYIEPAHRRSRQVALNAQREIERLYYPLPTTSSAEQPASGQAKPMGVRPPRVIPATR